MNLRLNARFWQWHNASWVKITLRPGQHLHHCRHQRTEEGWTTEYSDWEFDGSIVTSTYANEGFDCDGRSSYECTVECSLADLAGYDRVGDWSPSDGASPIGADDWFNGSPIRTPLWVKVGSSQRDYAAEAAGY